MTHRLLPGPPSRRWGPCTYLSEHKCLLVVDGVEPVARHGLGLVFFPDGVGRQPVHVHLDVGAHLLVGEELPRDDLHAALRRDHAVHWGLGERVELLVVAAHEVGLQQVAAVAVVLELALVQLHREVGRLEVQGYQLAAGVPEDLVEERKTLANAWASDRGNQMKERGTRERNFAKLFLRKGKRHHLIFFFA